MRLRPLAGFAADTRKKTLAGFRGAQERLGGRAILATMAGGGASCPEPQGLKARRLVSSASCQPPATGPIPVRAVTSQTRRATIMNAQNLSRRALLAGLAATSAIATSVFVTTKPAAATPDPIFAAIEAHRATLTAYFAAETEYRAAEDRVPAQYQSAPSIPVPLMPPGVDLADWKNLPTERQRCFNCFSVKQIDEVIELAGYAHVKGANKRWADCLRAEKRKYARVRNRAGLRQAGERLSLADDAELSARNELARTIPTTVPGTKALLAYWIKATAERAGGSENVDVDMQATTNLLASIDSMLGIAVA